MKCQEREVKMNDLIKVNYTESEQPTVSGRELHEALGVETPYHKWFPRMAEYGFTDVVMTAGLCEPWHSIQNYACDNDSQGM